MARLITQKLFHTAATLVLVSIAVAFLLDLSPADPAYAILGEQATPDQVELVHEELGLDDPLHVRYFRWTGDVLQGDFGTSYRTKEPVTESILSRLPVTIELVVLALAMSFLIAIPIGIVTAHRAGGRFDRAWQYVSSTMVSLPPFVSAIVLVLIFGIQLRGTSLHLPATGWVPLSSDLAGNLRTALLPAFTLALTEIPAFTRLLRADMIATLQEDYILAAKARGVPVRRVLLRHALRPSSLSLVTLAALSMGRLLGGTVIVETVFSLPGIGQLLIANILTNDVLVVQGVVMFIAIAYVLLNSLTDVSYSYLDPRVRKTAA